MNIIYWQKEKKTDKTFYTFKKILTEFSGNFSKKKVSLNPRTGGRRYYFPWFSKYAVYWHCSDQRTRKTKDTTPTKIFWKDFLKITQYTCFSFINLYPHQI